MLKLLPLLAVLGACQSCSPEQRCPGHSPCCTGPGLCGVGFYCLGGCDPRASFSLDACMPEPVCADVTYDMASADRIVDADSYLGDASAVDWVSDGRPEAANGNTLLTMAPETPGTTISSTRYIWFGNVKVLMKTSRDNGVHTAFALVSDVQDHIGLHFSGENVLAAHTDWASKGVHDDFHQATIVLQLDTSSYFRQWEIDWTPDAITWLVDGQTYHTVRKVDTWNASSREFAFPQTPARIQLSLSHDDSVGWHAEASQELGFYYATISRVDVACLGADAPPGTNSGTSYTYADYNANNASVLDGDNSTVLKSAYGSGLDAN